MTREPGRIRQLQIPCTRGLDATLRRNRLLAARCFPVSSMPRFAILSGQWDGGEVVSSAGASLQKGAPTAPVIKRGGGVYRKRNKRKASK